MIYRWNPAQVIYRQEDGSDVIESKVVPYGEWIEVDSVFEGNFMERFARDRSRRRSRRTSLA
jgi:hypothetical protein